MSKMIKPHLVFIGPGSAWALLKGNRNNRKFSRRTLEKYTREMKQGNWRRSGNSISIWFDEDGRLVLMNGQHRLTAIINSGIGLHFILVEEEEPDVFLTFDHGLVRQTHTLIGMAGYENSTVLAAMSKLVMLYEEHPGSSEPWPSNPYAGKEQVVWLDAQPRVMVDAAAHAFQYAHFHFAATTNWYAALAFLVRRDSVDAELWPIFHDGYSSGANLKPGSPVLALRQFVFNRSRIGRGNRGLGGYTDWDRQMLLGVGLRAWNDFLTDSNHTFYRFTKQSLPMPKVH